MDQLALILRVQMLIPIWLSGVRRQCKNNNPLEHELPMGNYSVQYVSHTKANRVVSGQ